MFRPLPVISALLLSLGGVVAIASPPGIFRSSVAQVPAAQPQTEPAKGDRSEASLWLRELKLSQAQLQQIRSIQQKYRPSLTEKRQGLKQAQQELRTLMVSDAPSSQVRDKYQQVSNLRQELANTQFESMLAMRDVLNVQQRQQFANRMDNQRQRFRRPMENHGMGQ